jgi:hypothetical protein
VIIQDEKPLTGSAAAAEFENAHPAVSAEQVALQFGI